jgi:hypothetical protein
VCDDAPHTLPHVFNAMCVTACHCKRLITLQYRGISLECRVRSPIEEVDLRIAAAIKGAATKDGLLQPLAFEADVVPAAPRAETKELAMMEYRLAKSMRCSVEHTVPLP